MDQLESRWSVEGQAEERQPRPPAVYRSFLGDGMQERKIGGHKSKAFHEKQRRLSMAFGYQPLPRDVRAQHVPARVVDFASNEAVAGTGGSCKKSPHKIRAGIRPHFSCGRIYCVESRLYLWARP